MRKIRYEEMLPAEFLEAVKRMPVFIVPMGLLEWHADHLPLGQDGLKAHGICLRLAEKLDGGIVLPPNYIGRPGFSTYTGTLTYSEGLVNLLISELCMQLRKVGGRVIVLMAGHYGPAQEECLARAAQIIMKENPDLRVIAHKECDGVILDGEMPGDHAGIWETSMFMSMYPHLAHMELLRDPPLEHKLYPDAPNDYYHESAIWEWPNDVKAATPELGRRALEAVTDHMAGEVRQALKELGLSEPE